MNLLIVESPAKAKTIQSYLTNQSESWTVLATGGHIIDLPKSRHGIAHQNNTFIPEWQVIEQKKGVLRKIKEAAKSAEHCFVGSDDDREGEAIASNIIQYASIKNPIRITFTEITKKAILTSLTDGVRPLDSLRVNAQEARRLVDREIGYPVSQIIRWDMKRQQSEHSPKGVGRIISPALSLISDTEKNIESFVSTPYAIIYADYNYNGQQFRLTNPHKFTEEQELELENTLAHFQSDAHEHVIYNYQRKTNDVTPYPPLITSRLQRCAFYLFGLTPKKTMKIAQQLYEGLAINGEHKGLITYPRTDSYTISDEATQEIINVLTEHYESEYVLSSPRTYKNKDNAQAAHEAIRPTAFTPKYFPKALKPFLTEEQFLVYRLIWGRALMTQMTNAVYDRSMIEIDVEGNKLLGRANYCLFKGWEILDGNQTNVSEQNEEERHKTKEVKLPEVIIGDSIEPMNIDALSLTSKAPPRYGIGRFITILDNKGIARPSTIDGILPSLENKGYIVTRQGMLYLTPLGAAVNDWVSTNAPWLNDVDKAREFELELDSIEKNEGKRDHIIGLYVSKVAELKKSLNYVDAALRVPTEEQLSYAKSLASSKEINLPAGVLTSQVKLSAFIKEHAPKQTTMGKCPTCKNDVVTTEKSYRCKEKSCDFYMVKSQVSRFIEQFQIDATPSDFAMALFQRKKNPCENLPGRQGKRFNAYIGLNKHDTYGWQPHIISFTKNIEAPIFRSH